MRELVYSTEFKLNWEQSVDLQQTLDSLHCPVIKLLALLCLSLLQKLEYCYQVCDSTVHFTAPVD